MADNTIVHYSGQWIFHQGEPAAGALLYVYNEDTTDLANIWSDRDLLSSLANPVTADANGLMPFAYIGTQAYKTKLTTSAGATIDEEDDITGALDTSPFSAATYAKPDTDVASKTSDYTMVAGDAGTVINGNCTGGAFKITLLSAVTVGNGRGIVIRHIGTANQVKIVTSSSQTITHPATGVTTTAFSLVGYGESVEFISDGANWHVSGYAPPLMRPNTPGVITITDRVSASPSSPSPGARYIVTGAFSTFEAEDIIEADGQGGFIEFTPPSDCGWIAYVQDEDRIYQFIGSAWAALTSISASQSEMEAASATDRLVVPARQHFHPGMSKLWVTYDGTGTPAINGSHNVSSITDHGTGDQTVNFSITFSSVNYCWNASVGRTDGEAAIGRDTDNAKSTTSLRLATVDIDPGGGLVAEPADCTEICLSILGDL